MDCDLITSVSPEGQYREIRANKVSRTYVITGAASGIGLATSRLLSERGATVIGVDIRDADVNVDLGSASGRVDLVERVASLSGGRIDAILAIAGRNAPTPETAAVNYFGAVHTLEGLRPLLLQSDAPRAVAVSSMTSLFAPDDLLLAALLSSNEEAALSRAAQLENQGNLIYSTTKRALAIWIRRNAASAPWAGASIPLNGVAPGVVATPMTAAMTATPQARAELATRVPMPLGGIFAARDLAYLLAWLAGEENAHLCGQVVFIDGGSDVVIRGDSTW